jgi:hypothetical protein
VKRGYANKFEVATLKKDLYYLNYDNKTGRDVHQALIRMPTFGKPPSGRAFFFRGLRHALQPWNP